MLKKCLAEAFGTAVIVYVACAANVNFANVPGGILPIALANGFGVAVVATGLMPLSGAHLNPAVTIGLLRKGLIELPLAAAYGLSQCIGATAGALLVGNSKAMVPAPSATDRPFLAEAMASFILMVSILLCAVRRPSQLSGLLVGLTVTFCLLLAGPTSGAALNPARWFGAAIASGEVQHAVLYLLGPILGMLVAVEVDRFLPDSAIE